jgi:site-specific recombinase XerD
MSTLHTTLEEYLALRRALGFQLKHVGRSLHQFVRFAEAQGTAFITTELALRWATQPVNVLPVHWARRLSMVRRFAQYCSAADPRTEIPPQGLRPSRYVRQPPYLYSEEEIRHLLQAARRLPSKIGLRPQTYTTLFGLLAVTGMRLSETLALDRQDVDLPLALITMRYAKGQKVRWVPIHRSTVRALEQYTALRDRLLPTPTTSSFFLCERGMRLSQWAVRCTFVQLSRQIGLRGPTESHGPRLHDLRHAFALRTLLGWYRSGVDVERRLPELATYLGHVHVSDTYWYLSAVPELLHLALQRVEPTTRGDD